MTFILAFVLQDGYEQLSLLPARTFKGLIRVRFINEQASLYCRWQDVKVRLLYM